MPDVDVDLNQYLTRQQLARVAALWNARAVLPTARSETLVDVARWIAAADDDDEPAAPADPEYSIRRHDGQWQVIETEVTPTGRVVDSVAGTYPEEATARRVAADLSGLVEESDADALSDAVEAEEEQLVTRPMPDLTGVTRSTRDYIADQVDTSSVAAFATELVSVGDAEPDAWRHAPTPCTAIRPGDRPFACSRPDGHDVWQHAAGDGGRILSVWPGRG